MISSLKRAVPAFAFLAIAFWILLGFQDLLFTAQLRTPFLPSAMFWDELYTEPFAVMRWLGCWFTQTGYYPMLAIALYLVIWGIGYWLLAKTLRLPQLLASLVILPFACQLLGITSVGYWIYIMKEWGFWFSQPLAFLLMLVLLWGCRQFSNQKAIIPMALLCIAVYPIIGCYAILLSYCLLILGFKEHKWAVWPFVVPMLSPMIWKVICFSHTSNERMWLSGFPSFNDADTYILRPSAPFIALAVVMLALCVVSVVANPEFGKSSKYWKNLAVTVLVALVSFVGVKLFAFTDYNYQAEMRMSKYAMAEDWRAVLKEAQKAEAPSRSMVLLQNIALMNTGQLGEQAFKLGNNGIKLNDPDGIQMNSMQIVGPLVYYNYGKLNFTLRWSIEFAVGYGYSPYHLMNMIRAAEAKGEHILAKKYLGILHSHLFYRDWEPRAASPLVKTLDRSYSNVLDSDNNSVERYLIEMYSKSYMSPNPAVVELSIFNAMLCRDPNLFWNAFAAYYSLHRDAPLPLHYQEAYCAFMNIAPVELSQEVNISQFVTQSFQNFLRVYGSLKQAGKSDEEIGKEMKSKWSKTYFWYFLFGNKTY